MPIRADVDVVGAVDESVAIDVAKDRGTAPLAPSHSLRTPTRSWLLTTPSSLKSPGSTSSWRVKVAIVPLPMVIITRSALVIGLAKVIV